jgi:charged multivesicular body protein 6
MQIESLIAREFEIAKELLAAKKRDRALLALRKKKLREGQLEQIDAYLLNVEQVCCSIPSGHVEGN